MKGAAAGGVGAAVVMGATVALAGTGIGGVFNLGQTNTVNGTSTLTGADAGKAGLSVTNTSTTAGSSALSLTAAVGKPTLTVSNSAQIQSLNASLLGGYTRSWLNRAGLYSNESLFGLNATETDGTVAMTAPAAGFVRVEATFIADDAFSASFCTKCLVEARLHDVTSATDSPMTVATGGDGSSATYVPVTVQWVFPVKPGPHSYSLTTVQYDTGGPFQIDNPVVTAQYIPFGSTGTPTTLAGNVSTSSESGTGDGQPVWHGR